MNIKELKEKAKDLSYNIDNFAAMIPTNRDISLSELIGILSYHVEEGKVFTRRNEFLKKKLKDPDSIAKTEKEFKKLEQAVLELDKKAKLRGVLPNQLLLFALDSKEFANFYQQLVITCESAHYQIPEKKEVAFAKQYVLTHTPMVLYALYTNQPVDQETIDSVKGQFQVYYKEENKGGNVQFKEQLIPMFQTIEEKFQAQKVPFSSPKIMQKGNF